MNLAFLQAPGPMELVIIFLVVLVFFGAKRLPDLFASFGKSIKEFKKATQDIEKDINTSMNSEPRPVAPPKETVSSKVEAPESKETPNS
jgi:sec-independent protein translocase protein TatA